MSSMTIKLIQVPPTHPHRSLPFDSTSLWPSPTFFRGPNFRSPSGWSDQQKRVRPRTSSSPWEPQVGTHSTFRLAELHYEAWSRDINGVLDCKIARSLAKLRTSRLSLLSTSSLFLFVFFFCPIKYRFRP
jgi:hypothetical protein